MRLFKVEAGLRFAVARLLLFIASAFVGAPISFLPDPQPIHIFNTDKHLIAGAP